MYENLPFGKLKDCSDRQVICGLICAALWASLLTPAAVSAAGIGETVPSKCKSTDVDYSISNIVPTGVCNTINDSFTVNFDVNVWGNPSRYNLAVGYTLSGDPVLIDLSCLQTGSDLDGVGCEDYPGTGSQTNPICHSIQLQCVLRR